MDKDLAEAARKGFCEMLIEELIKDVQWLKSQEPPADSVSLHIRHAINVIKAAYEIKD